MIDFRYHLVSIVAVFLALVGIAMAIYLISFRSPASLGSSHTPEHTSETSMAPAAPTPAPANPTATGNGISSLPSHHSVDETVARLTGLLEAKGVKVFAVIDHSGEAQKVGLEMRPTKVVIFGSPKAGTPLMVAAPSLAIDLPLKALVAEDDLGKVWVTYNAPEYLNERHGVPEQLIKNLAGAGTVIAKAVD